MSVTVAVGAQALQDFEVRFMPFIHFGDSCRMMMDFDACFTVLVAENSHGLHLASLTVQPTVLPNELDLLRARLRTH